MHPLQHFRRAADLSLREKIAQLIFVRIGSNLPPVRRVEEDEERVARLLEECPVGGLLLFNGGPETKATLERLQAIVEDAAAGRLRHRARRRAAGRATRCFRMRWRSGSWRRAIERRRLCSKRLAREARDVGIHITFAPVADVNTNPLNPIISIRAFSDDAERAAAADARSIVEAGRGSRAAVRRPSISRARRHAPGFARFAAIGRRSRSTSCERASCVPFQAAIDAGCSLIMTAHVAFPSIDPSGVPATLSPIILHELLRDEMGFQGVVCSDSLLMAGVRDRFANEGEMALATLNAGVDLLLDLTSRPRSIDYLVRMRRDGHARSSDASTRRSSACWH